MKAPRSPMHTISVQTSLKVACQCQSVWPHRQPVPQIARLVACARAQCMESRGLSETWSSQRCYYPYPISACRWQAARAVSPASAQARRADGGPGSTGQEAQQLGPDLEEAEIADHAVLLAPAPEQAQHLLHRRRRALGLAGRVHLRARAPAPDSAPGGPLAAPSDILRTSRPRASTHQHYGTPCCERYAARKRGDAADMSPHPAKPHTWPAMHSAPLCTAQLRGWFGSKSAPSEGTSNSSAPPQRARAAPGRCRSACSPSGPAPTRTPGARAPPGCARAATPPAARALGESIRV